MNSRPPIPLTPWDPPPPYPVDAPDTLLELMQRDLEAWTAAKAAIAKAMEA